MKRINETEPPSCPHPSLFMIGQDGRGNWVVQDQSGIRGGLSTGPRRFASCALRIATVRKLALPSTASSSSIWCERHVRPLAMSP
jgi:hypothetical protein